ncbi:hypothetical protein BKA69DRAFT_711044 [Paraphysoderma sedebokerense]|nr:hypothetical protein BKA69DRAFT_711044 [Paraphysoderma sedebokerense]
MTAGNSKKRPRGLKASSSSTPTESTYDSQPTKKVRSTVESDLSSTSQSDDGSRTIMMPDVEEGNEIAETQALFDMAMDKLGTSLHMLRNRDWL